MLYIDTVIMQQHALRLRRSIRTALSSLRLRRIRLLCRIGLLRRIWLLRRVGLLGSIRLLRRIWLLLCVRLLCCIWLLRRLIECAGIKLMQCIRCNLLHPCAYFLNPAASREPCQIFYIQSNRILCIPHLLAA